MEEIKQLQRRVNEQVLERAETDPNWRRQLLDDPQTAEDVIPEAKQLREMMQGTTTATAREEYDLLQRSLMEKILDKASSEPTWKQQLLEDPEATLQEANFPEAKRIEELHQEEMEVSGHQRWQEQRDALNSAGAVPMQHCHLNPCGDYYWTNWSV